MCRVYIQQKGGQIFKMWECEWWNIYKTDRSVKNHLTENFHYKRPLSEERLMQGFLDGKLFGYDMDMDSLDVILNFLNICVATFQIFLRYSITPWSVMKILAL